MHGTRTHFTAGIVSVVFIAVLVFLSGIGGIAQTAEEPDKKTPRSQSSQGGPENMPDGVIGVSLQVSAEHIGDPARLYVAHIHPEGPARQAGLKHGDEVISVDGASVEGKTYEQVVRMVRGEPGTAVKLQVKSEGNPRDTSITRVPSGTLYKAPMGSHEGPAK
ncbi:MAG: PDZ domain-containing protein [Nitrospiraceae bacterium]